MAELLNDDQHFRFGYADDIALYRTSPTLEHNVELLGQDVGKILDWGDENKVGLNPAKCEIMHFSRSWKRTHFPAVKAVGHDFTIHEGQDKAVRWLGVWFDRKLSFKQHVHKGAAAAQRVANHIRGLANTVHGPPPKALRKAVISCIIPVMTYAAEAWFPGTSKPATNLSQAAGRNVSTNVNGHLAAMDRVLKAALRAVLPVWKTTPVKTLYRDAGIPTAEIALEKCRLRQAHRLKAVDDNHPLVPRILPIKILKGRGTGGFQRPKTKLQLALKLLPDFPRPKLVIPRFAPGSTARVANNSKNEAAKAFERWVTSLPDTHLVVYSNGSKSEEGNVGYGYVICRGKDKIAQGKGRLSDAKVFDGEAKGAIHGLKHAMKLHQGKPIHVCLNNTAVITGLRGDPSDSSQAAFLEFHEIATTAEIHTHWVPGHKGVQGNEDADEQAKAGAALPERITAHAATLATAKRMLKALINKQFSDWWELVAPANYVRLKLKALLKCPPELKYLSRRVLHHYLAARTGHGDFEWYHKKFNHDDYNDYSCGSFKSQQHLVHCRKARESNSRWPKHAKERRGKGRAFSPEEYWSWLVTSPEQFLHFCEATEFFSKICPRHRPRDRPLTPQASTATQV